MNQQIEKEVSVLVVDDEEPIRRVLQRLLKRNNIACFQASNGEDALKILATEDVDVVITDIAMPVMNGIELTKKIKAHYDSDVIMMTGYLKDLTYGDAVAKGASDFVQKPFNMDEFQIRIKRVLRERSVRAELNQSLKKMQEILDGVINSLSSTVEARDPYTSGHQNRVSSIAVSIARSMKLPDHQVDGIRMAALIHDLGKIAIPAEILSKPGRLSTIEFDLIKTHSQVGYDILKDIPFPVPIADIIYQHHERMDGTGYPRGIKGDEILLESRIIAVADVVEAMSSHRPYRPALGIDKAIEAISAANQTIYAPDVVTACLTVINDQGI